MLSCKFPPPLLSTQFSSVTQSCPTLCDPMDCSIPGFLVHHQHMELSQIHVHRVGDAIQPSHHSSSTSFLPSILPIIRVFSKESALCIRWPKYWSFSFRISPSSEYSGLISFRFDLFDLPVAQGTFKSFLQHHRSVQFAQSCPTLCDPSTTVQKHQFFATQLSLWPNSHIHTWLLVKPYLLLDGPLLAR